MTPQEIREAVLALIKEMGPGATLSVEVHSRRGAQPIWAFAQPLGYSKDAPTISLYADDWAEAIEGVRAAWAEMSERVHAETIKKMALAIIRITAEQGECTDAALRTEFDLTDCERYGEAACEKANEMAANGPFSIRQLAGANAA